MSTLYQDLNNTTFPNAIDGFLQMQDLNAEDMPLVKQYQSYMLAGNLVAASQVLSQIPNGANKLISALKYNQLRDAVLATERFYKTDVQPFVRERQKEWQAIIDKFDYKGTFQSTYTYQKNNIVEWVDTFGKNNLYLAVSDAPTGTLPSNVTYWVKMTVQGAKGDKGNGLSYTGTWDSTAQYGKDSLVSYGDSLWYATQPSLNQVPYDGSSYWINALSITSSGIPVAEEAPYWISEGDIWFKLVG